MIAEKRILKPVDAAAARLVADAFRRTENLPGATRDVLLTDGDGEAFRRTYPFSPAFMQTLVHVSSALQRERTALKLMQQILVDRRDDLRLGQLVPFGDLFDAIADGNDQPFTEKLKHEFDRSRSLYQRRMRPMLLEQRKLTDDQAAGRAEVAPAVLAAFRADDRLAKTLLLSALAPDVPALRGMTARRLAALNHGTVHSMIPGQEVAEVIRRLRSWASRVPELKVGQEDDPSVRLQLVGVDTGQILELVAHVDNDAAHRRLFRELLLRELGIGDDGAFELEHAIVWRGSRRSVEIVYGNVRDRAELRDEVFEPAQPGRWRLVLDYPFDAAHFSGAEDRNRLMELKARHDERGPRRCLAWLPGFVTREVLSKVGTLVRIEYLLSGGRLDENATRLGADDRQRARDLLRNQGENLRAELRIVLRQAYGLAKPEDHNVLDWSDHLISLDPALHPKLDVGRSFPDALASLVEQCYAATYPEHPNLDPHRKGQPVSPAEVRTVLAVVRRAIDADGGRTETDKPERPALQRLAHPLRLGEEHGGPFVLSRHWETEFERRAARLPGVDVAVREVRGWLADLGLETRVENLVIATYAELSRRAWVQANQVVDPPASVDDEGWTGTSVLYICPLRALLNNLQPRLDDYAQWLGRSARYWHGDAGQAARRQTQLQRPDFLLTTPESLESMLVSRSVDSGAFLADVRVVVVDEVHAFAGDDRGWHLVHVVERIVQLAGRPLQRIGLSATVGNPEDLLTWLQGAAAGRPRRVVARPAAAPGGEVQLDHVGSIEGAATVISRLHRGEKRLVFVDSRRRAEELGSALRARDVDTHLSHSSLSATERRRSEQAFAQARDCVIVATSTLELGIDVGDLDRVIQIGAPRTVASFLQRLGRTGRRPGTSRNCLFLALDQDQTLHAAGLLSKWAQGWVEPVVPPSSPRHVVAQQLLALALQENTIGLRTWPEWWHGIAPMAADGAEILGHLVDEGFLDTDGGLAFIGPSAERHFGRRHFMELMAVFTAAPEFTVYSGRAEIGSVGDDALLTDTMGQPRVLLLAGRAWKVTHVDWKRRRSYVEATDLPGQARWSGRYGGLSFEITRGMRDVLLGADPPGVGLSRRASAALGDLRQHHSSDVDEHGTVLRRTPDGDVHWWTWAGVAANRTLHASLGVVDPRQRLGDRVLRLRHGTDLRRAAAELRGSKVAELIDPAVDITALRGLKFSAALTEAMARNTVAGRLGDKAGSAEVLREDRVLNRNSEI